MALPGDGEGESSVDAKGAETTTTEPKDENDQPR